MNTKRLSGKPTVLVCILLLSLALLLTGVADVLAREDALQARVLRLHVLAHSDSEADQAVKLRVRDAILAAGGDFFDGSVDVTDAAARLHAHLPEILAAANGTLQANGMPYGAVAEVVTEYFPARQYGDLTLPAGRYQAVRVTLGDGRGQNWFCVMFPPLCLPAATERAASDCFDASEMQILQPKDGFVVRCKLAEVFREVWEKLKGGWPGAEGWAGRCPAGARGHGCTGLFPETGRGTNPPVGAQTPAPFTDSARSAPP